MIIIIISICVYKYVYMIARNEQKIYSNILKKKKEHWTHEKISMYSIVEWNECEQLKRRQLQYFSFVFFYTIENRKFD